MRIVVTGVVIVTVIVFGGGMVKSYLFIFSVFPIIKSHANLLAIIFTPPQGRTSEARTTVGGRCIPLNG